MSGCVKAKGASPPTRKVKRSGDEREYEKESKEGKEGKCQERVARRGGECKMRDDIEQYCIVSVRPVK